MTTGRRTGKPRRKCMRVIVDDSVAYLVMLGPVMLSVPKDQAVVQWLRNTRATSLETATWQHPTMLER